MKKLVFFASLTALAGIIVWMIVDIWSFIIAALVSFLGWAVLVFMYVLTLALFRIFVDLYCWAFDTEDLPRWVCKLYDTADRIL